MADNNETLAETFGQRITSTYEQMENPPTYKEIAERLGVSNGIVSQWFNGHKLPKVSNLLKLAKILNQPIDWLLGKHHLEDSSEGHEWYMHNPYPHNPTLTRNIHLAFEIFRLVVKEKKSYVEIENSLRESNPNSELLQPKHIYRYIKMALFSHAIRFTKVLRNTELETKLNERFPLINVTKAELLATRRFIVANLDLPRDKNNQVVHQINTEAVAFLASHEADLIQNIVGNSNRVAITGGRPVSRFCDLIPDYPNLAVDWRSLLVTEGVYQDLSNVSANSLIEKLLRRLEHRGSKLPNYSVEQRDTPEARRYINEIRESSGAILSLGSPLTHFDRTGGRARGRAALLELWKSLPPDEQKKCVGDILLRLVDTNGKVIGDEKHKKANENLVFSPSLDDLKHLARSANVWILGEDYHKAPVIKVALEQGIANSLVADKWTAETLLRL